MFISFFMFFYSCLHVTYFIARYKNNVKVFSEMLRCNILSIVQYNKNYNKNINFNMCSPKLGFRLESARSKLLTSNILSNDTREFGISILNFRF